MAESETGRPKFGDDDVVVPILFWAEADYERAVALSDDEMPETYAAWQKYFRAVESSLPPGAIVFHVKCDPDEVAEWCRSQNRQVTAKNRAVYVVERFRREHGM